MDIANCNQDLFMHIPMSIYWKDLNGVYLGCNLYTARIAGVKTPDEVIGKTDFDFCWAQQANTLQKNDKKIIRTGEISIVEERGKVADGSTGTFLSTKFPLRDGDQIIGIFGMSVSIDDYKEREEELRKEKEKTEFADHQLRNIINRMPGHIYWTDKKGALLGCNKQQAKSFGFSSADQIIGKSIHEVGEILDWDPETADSIQKNNDEVIQKGQVNIEEETAILDGVQRVFLSYKYPLFDDENDVSGLLGISIDITDRKEMEEKLKKAKEDAELKGKYTSNYLKSIIDKLPGHIYWTDKEGILLGCNKQQAINFGFSSADELCGKSIHEVGEILGWDRSIADAIQKNNDEVIQNGEPKIIEETGTFSDGVRHDLLSYKYPLFDEEDKNVTGFLGISVDITDRKRAEEQLKKAKEEAELANKIKTEFITNMEHDIRTPAQGLASYAKEMLDTEPDEERKESWQVMARSGKRLLSVLNSILEFTRLESGTLPVFEEPFSLKETLLEVVDMEFPAAKVKGLNLECVIADDIPEYVLGDELRINRTLINLISNAIKFTPSGFIRVSAEQTKKSESMVSPHEVMIAITIEDSGVGISKDKVRQIFEKFYRGDASNQEKYTGSGLGLYLTKKMLEDIGGQITVCSEVDQGTRFTCCIPFKISFFRGKEKPLLAQKRGASKETTRPIDSEGLRVLLVEDDFIAQHVGKNLLSNTFHCQVHLAETGKKAINLSRTQPYDLIFLDLGLPDQTGVEVAHEIRVESQNLSTPIIAVTAHSKESSGEKTKKDMNDFITKPLDPHKLREVIDKWITPSHLSKLKMKKTDQAEKKKGKRKSQAIEKKLESSDKVIDLKLGINASGAGEDFVKEMLAMLHAELPEALEQLNIAYEAKDFKTMRKIAHKLRGGASYCGTPRLKHVAALLDEALLKKKKAVATLYKELIKEIHLLQKEYKKL